MSTAESVMLFGLKRPSITPFLKRCGSDKENVNNHPTSNLPFISTLIDKLIAMRMEVCLEHNYLQDSYNSAYPRGNLTESALLKLQPSV